MGQGSQQQQPTAQVYNPLNPMGGKFVPPPVQQQQHYKAPPPPMMGNPPGHRQMGQMGQYYREGYDPRYQGYQQ
ncbi:unnamed protein product [Sphagnum balticum]